MAARMQRLGSKCTLGLKSYQEVVNVIRAMGDCRGKALAFGNMGTWLLAGENRVAIECPSEQLQVAREIGDRGTDGSELGSTSLALDKLGDRQQAITHQKPDERYSKMPKTEILPRSGCNCQVDCEREQLRKVRAVYRRCQRSAWCVSVITSVGAFVLLKESVRI